MFLIICAHAPHKRRGRRRTQRAMFFGRKTKERPTVTADPPQTGLEPVTRSKVVAACPAAQSYRYGKTLPRSVFPARSTAGAAHAQRNLFISSGFRKGLRHADLHNHAATDACTACGTIIMGL